MLQRSSCRLTRAVSTVPSSVRVTQHHQLYDDPYAGRSLKLVAAALKTHHIIDQLVRVELG
jgi:hypothetical protein